MWRAGGFVLTRGMWPYHPDLLDKPVPRYTSFPTAAEFRDDIGPVDYAAALEGASGDISLSQGSVWPARRGEESESTYLPVAFAPLASQSRENLAR